jgi:hypothetical protein
MSHLTAGLNRRRCLCHRVVVAGSVDVFGNDQIEDDGDDG